MLKLTKADVHTTFAGLCRGDDMRDIGKNIRKLRESKGLTQDQLAEKLFVRPFQIMKQAGLDRMLI